MMAGYAQPYYPANYPGYYSGWWTPPPRVWTVFVAFVVAFIAGIGVGTVIPVMIVVVQHHGPFQSGEELMATLKNSIVQPLVLLSSGAATQVMLLATALGAAILSPVKPTTKRLRLNPSTLSPLGYIIAGIGALAVSVLFSAIVGLIGIKESGTLKLMGDVFRQLTPLEVAFAVLVVGISPGFGEEFLFRGYIQTRLVQRWGRWIGIILTALLFGLMHMDPLQSPFAAAFGIYLGYLAEQTGSIRPTMFCHMLNNSVQVLIGRYANGTGEPSWQNYATMAIVAGVVLTLCILYLTLAVHPPPPREEPAPGPMQPPPFFMPPPAVT